MFEESLGYQLIKNSGIPWLVRHDRSFYKTDPALKDPVRIYITASRVAILAYFVGRLLKQKPFVLPTIVLGLAMGYLLVSDLQLLREGKYQ